MCRYSSLKSMQPGTERPKRTTYITIRNRFLTKRCKYLVTMFILECINIRYEINIFITDLFNDYCALIPKKN